MVRLSSVRGERLLLQGNSDSKTDNPIMDPLALFQEISPLGILHPSAADIFNASSIPTPRLKRASHPVTATVHTSMSFAGFYSNGEPPPKRFS